MSDKLDAEEIVDLTLLEVGNLPKVGDRMDVRILAVGNSDLHRQHLPLVGSGGEIIYYSEALLPVHADHGGKHIEIELGIVLEFFSKLAPVFGRHVYEKDIAFLESSRRANLADAVFNAHYIA